MTKPATQSTAEVTTGAAGVEGNSQLTAVNGMILLVSLAVESVTVALVAVMEDPVGDRMAQLIALPDRHAEGLVDQISPQMILHCPTEDAARAAVADRAQVQPPLPGAH